MHAHGRADGWTDELARVSLSHFLIKSHLEQIRDQQVVASGEADTATASATARTAHGTRTAITTTATTSATATTATRPKPHTATDVVCTRYASSHPEATL